MKLRYHTVKNHITAETVKAYATENQLTLMQAKRMLEHESTTRLQYWDDDLEKWVDVPYVTEFRNESQTTD